MVLATPCFVHLGCANNDYRVIITCRLAVNKSLRAASKIKKRCQSLAWQKTKKFLSYEKYTIVYFLSDNKIIYDKLGILKTLR